MTTALEQMSEDELLERASVAMLKATALPPGSLTRSIQWAVYDTYSGELGRRALLLIAGKARP